MPDGKARPRPRLLRIVPSASALPALDVERSKLSISLREKVETVGIEPTSVIA
jgi:hypothetical protein